MFMHHYIFAGRGSRFIGGPLIVLFLALALIAAVGVAVLLINRDRQLARPIGQVPTQAQQPAAARILDERFARGEIDDEEYLRRKRMLSTDPAPLR
jgi:putative membrane protein